MNKNISKVKMNESFCAIFGCLGMVLNEILMVNKGRKQNISKLSQIKTLKY